MPDRILQHLLQSRRKDNNLNVALDTEGMLMGDNGRTFSAPSLAPGFHTDRIRLFHHPHRLLNEAETPDSP
jgi:hypothetical protein